MPGVPQIGLGVIAFLLFFALAYIVISNANDDDDNDGGDIGGISIGF